MDSLQALPIRVLRLLHTNNQPLYCRLDGVHHDQQKQQDQKATGAIAYHACNIRCLDAVPQETTLASRDYILGHLMEI
jgi:hypothetical protein